MNERGQRRKFNFKKLSYLMDTISHMIYPNQCIICDEELVKDNSSICNFCTESLQYTQFEKFTEPTSLDKLFWGRVQLEKSFSLLFFEKGKSTQKILHALKYKSNPIVGVEFGKLIGKTLKGNNAFKDLDLLIPVPLHPKKEFTRGYNQSEKLADGISLILNIHVDTTFLKKHKHTGSQTRRGRFGRWDNVVNNFGIKRQNTEPKHIAIIDDVITTGATLEAIIQSVKEIYPDIRVSIISLALTK
jgi:ComF family protein